MPAFSHLDVGTSEAVWRSDPRLLDRPDLPMDIGDLVVVAAHPDDETLGAAGLIRRVHRRGGTVTVIVATDGEASHPDSPTHTCAQLAALRRSEAEHAVGLLAEGTQLHFLGIPDGALRENRDRLVSGIAAILDRREGRQDESDLIVVAPWSGDGHRDHRVAAEAVAEVCEARGIRHLGYPIWLWHWGAPADVPWESAMRLTMTPAEVALKRSAIAMHVSQLEPISPAVGDEAVLHAEMRAHFEREVELFLAEPPADAASSMTAEWFEKFYAKHEDPWGFETRWYERRKRSVLMAALPKAEIGEVLEIGCSTGLITRELAARAGRVVALDPVRSAVEAARARVDDDHVTFSQGEVPRDWPEGQCDTVVLSEVGYYLSPRDLARTIRLIEDCLADDGCLVACHWRHPVAEYPQTGDDVHAALRASTAWETTVRHEERDFILEVFSRRPARSVAQREGLA